jgi:hypothetical protein
VLLEDGVEKLVETALEPGFSICIEEGSSIPMTTHLDTGTYRINEARLFGLPMLRISFHLLRLASLSAVHRATAAAALPALPYESEPACNVWRRVLRGESA